MEWLEHKAGDKAEEAVRRAGAAGPVVGALVGIAHGYDATQSIFESVAMASNGGISSGVCSQGMPASLELFYMLEMWAGRLEFLTLIALIVEVVVTLDPRRVVKSRLVRRS